MARINLDDSIYKQKSFEYLIIKLGSRRMALGALVEAFTLAQDYFLNAETNSLIPVEIWNREGMAPELLESGFAQLKKGGIYVRGSEYQFNWLIQRQRAGIKSGITRLNSSKENKNKNLSHVSLPSTVVNGRSTVVNGAEPLTLSLTLSSKKEIIYIPQFDILDLYKLYPRKLGKAKGLLALTRLIKTQQKYDDVKTAISNYSAFLKKEQVEPKFIKHFPTFINNYTDWLDLEAGSTDIQTVENVFENIDGVLSTRTNENEQCYGNLSGGSNNALLNRTSHELSAINSEADNE